jgi:hypothetical protein
MVAGIRLPTPLSNKSLSVLSILVRYSGRSTSARVTECSDARTTRPNCPSLCRSGLLVLNPYPSDGMQSLTPAGCPTVAPDQRKSLIVVPTQLPDSWPYVPPSPTPGGIPRHIETGGRSRDPCLDGYTIFPNVRGLAVIGNPLGCTQELSVRVRYPPPKFSEVRLSFRGKLANRTV